MKIVYFTHSLLSCWNHGNAHFLRGVLRELQARGHNVLACEQQGNWSLANLLADHGQAGLAPFREHYPELSPASYATIPEALALAEGADLVIAHEWNPPELIAALGERRKAASDHLLLFHDTHHRAVSAPEEMQAFDLEAYDGVLAFGAALARIYRDRGWGARAFVWHEAADLRHFQPPGQEGEREGLIWIGNWGDGERSEELERFLLEPAEAAGLPLDIYGVRYPEPALAMLRRHGARYHGWAANARTPDLFARHLATVHVPRRYYTQLLPGIPTIRVFEALACGIPLVSAPWDDEEGLFRPGIDYLVAADGAQMTRHLRMLAHEPGARAELVRHGLEAVRSRHGCGHRAEELLAIARTLSPRLAERSAA